MSLRNRLEQERAIQAQIEFELEEERLAAIKRRIHDAIVWSHYPDGIKVQDLTPDLYPTILDIVREEYVNQEVLCRNSYISDDEVSLESFLLKVKMCLKDRKSIIALDDDNEDKIAGFMILKSVPKAHFGRVFSRVLYTEGKAIKKMQQFLNALNRHVEIYDDMECENYLRYYVVHVMEGYQNREIISKLFEAGFDVARSLKIPVVMGIFTTYKLQDIAFKLGMKILKEIYYISWITPDGNLIFCDPGAGNYSAALMAGKVPPPPEPPPPPPPTPEEIEKEKKMTREEKRIRKAKRKLKAEQEMNLDQ